MSTSTSITISISRKWCKCSSIPVKRSRMEETHQNKVIIARWICSIVRREAITLGAWASSIINRVWQIMGLDMVNRTGRGESMPINATFSSSNSMLGQIRSSSSKFRNKIITNGSTCPSTNPASWARMHDKVSTRSARTQTSTSRWTPQDLNIISPCKVSAPNSISMAKTLQEASTARNKAAADQAITRASSITAAQRSTRRQRRSLICKFIIKILDKALLTVIKYKIPAIISSITKAVAQGSSSAKLDQVSSPMLLVQLVSRTVERAAPSRSGELEAAPSAWELRHTSHWCSLTRASTPRTQKLR